MSNYCACSGGDEEYTIELNQQGPEGPQGPVGPEGFSPSISVKTNTENAYILTVVNKEETFDTPNLYGELEKLNADLSNIPNPAYINGIALSRSNEGIPSIEIDGSKITTGINGNLMLSTSSENEQGTESFNYEVVVNPKDQRLELHDNEGTVKIVATTDYIPTINVATTTTAGIVKPDGSTITVSPDGTISAVQQDLSNLATKEELASTNATVTNLQTTVASNTTSIGTLREDLTNLETTVGNNSADIAALDANKLDQSNIIAGANITIDRNGNNLTINSIGGGGGSGAAIDDSNISSASTWSSSKINTEITTVANTKNDNIFDIGKFTVVGSPTITDDGIASGFSNSNYINTRLTFNPSESIEYICGFKTGNDVSSSTSKTIWRLYNNLTEHWETNAVRIQSGDIKIQVKDDYSIGWACQANTTYIVRVKFTSTAIYYTIYNENMQVLANNTYTTSTTMMKANNSLLSIGYSSSQAESATGGYLTTGSIDLKNFSITVDGKEVFNGLMESTKPIYDKIATTNTTLSTFQTDTDNNFSAVNSALNEKANLSDLAGYVTINKYNELLSRVVALETEINGGNA